MSDICVIRCLRCDAPLGPAQVFSAPVQRLQPALAQNVQFRLESGTLLLAHDRRAILAYCPNCAPDVKCCCVCGCTDEVSCEGGCAWRQDNPKEGAWVCTGCIPPALFPEGAAGV